MIPFSNTTEVRWSSFMPALVSAIADTKGNILEIGIGHFSTPMLNAVANLTHRHVYSVEDNAEWGGMFKAYDGEFHHVMVGEYDEILTELAKFKDWSVVFIDESPGGERRKKSFELFYDKAEYVVVHDFHRENEEAIKPLLKGPYRVFDQYEPPTLRATGI